MSRGEYSNSFPDEEFLKSPPRRTPLSVQEARVQASSVRVGHGRYLMTSPTLVPHVPGVSGNRRRLYESSVDPVRSMPEKLDDRSNEMSSNAVGRRPPPAPPRRPIKAFGDGQLCGHPVVPYTPFAKIAEMLPSRIRKRPYYDDSHDDDEVLASTSDDVTSNTMSMMPKRKMANDADVCYPPIGVGSVMDCGEARSSRHADHYIEQTSIDQQKTIVLESADILDSGIQYEEEVVDVIDGNCESTLLIQREVGLEEDVSTGTSRTNEMLRGLRRDQSLRMEQLSTVKQMRGENAFLKDQLEASVYRIKELESLLVERNQRLKEMLAENLRLSWCSKKLAREVGVDIAKSLLGPSGSDLL